VKAPPQSSFWFLLSLVLAFAAVVVAFSWLAFWLGITI
jgi:hypothetical protein